MISRFLAVTLVLALFLLGSSATSRAADVSEGYAVRCILERCEHRDLPVPWSNLSISVTRSSVDFYHGAHNIFQVSLGTRAGRGTKWLFRGAVDRADGVILWLDDLRARIPGSKQR